MGDRPAVGRRDAPPADLTLDPDETVCLAGALARRGRRRQPARLNGTRDTIGRTVYQYVTVGLRTRTAEVYTGTRPAAGTHGRVPVASADGVMSLRVGGGDGPGV